MDTSYIPELSIPLEDNTILLRPLVPTDFDALFAVASDPLVWEQHPDRYRYTREVFEKFFTGALQSAGAYCVFDKQSGAMIGSSRYYNLHPEEYEKYSAQVPLGSTISIGYTFLARMHWGGTYNHSMKRLMINNAFQTFDTVVFQVGEENVRSQTAVERIGAQRIPVTDDLQNDGGGIDTHVVFVMNKELWDASPINV